VGAHSCGIVTKLWRTREALHRHTKFIIKHLQSFCPNENNQRTRVQPARTYCSSQHNSTGVHKGKGRLMQAPVDRLLLDPRRLRWRRGFTSKAQSEAQTRAVKVPSHASHCTFVSCRCAPRREHMRLRAPSSNSIRLASDVREHVPSPAVAVTVTAT